MNRWFLSILTMIVAMQSKDTPTLEQVIQRTVTYVDTYTKALGNVVGEERYVQKAIYLGASTRRPERALDASAAVGTTSITIENRYVEATRQRHTVADFRTTSVGEEWVGIRHVREVDGLLVDPSFSGRLGETFDLSSPEGRIKTKRAIAFENSRFNIGDLRFTTNIPTFPLEVFRSQYVGGYSIKKIGEEVVDEVRTWKVKVDERIIPDAIDSSRSRLSGTFWIDPASGEIHQAEIGFDTLTSTFSMETRADTLRKTAAMKMRVQFKRDPILRILVPVSMDDSYLRSLNDEASVEGHATYSRFRQFGSDSRFIAEVDEAKAEQAGILRMSDDTYSIRVNVPIVSVEVWVTKNNQPVLDLTADDFTVTENAIPQTITNFSPVSAPCDVLLLFDHSGSMTERIDLMQQAGRALIRGMRDQDRIGLASFSTSLRMLTRWTDTRDTRQRAYSLGRSAPCFSHAHGRW
jgi:hypothetical protein